MNMDKLLGGDFGDEPLWPFIPHEGLTAFAGVMGGIVSATWLGMAGPLLFGTWAYNNLRYMSRNGRRGQRRTATIEAVNVEAVEVDNMVQPHHIPDAGDMVAIVPAPPEPPLRSPEAQAMVTVIAQSFERPAPPVTTGDSSGLLERLKAECPELLRLVKAPPIRLVGLQRTGKSTFARGLTLLRMALLEGHTARWATPHREADNPVPAALNPLGHTPTGAKDYPAIEALWAKIQHAIDQGQTLNLTVVWDEFGGYDQFSDLDLLSNNLRAMLREATKFGYHPILIAHGDQASFYPGVSGILGTLKASTIKVETLGQPKDAFGTMAPTGRAVVTWLDGTESRITWPDWLTTDYLLTVVCNNAPEENSPEENSPVDEMLSRAQAWVKRLNGCPITPALVATSSWVAWGKRNGVLPDAKTDTILPWIVALEENGVIRRLSPDKQTWVES